MPEKSSPDTRKPLARQSLVAWLLLLALFVFHLGANLWWLHTDNHTIRVDEEVHMHEARRHYEALAHHANPSFLDKVIAVSRLDPSIPAHPPFLHVLGALMIGFVGYGTDVLAFTSTLAFLLALTGCFLILRRFLPPLQAVFCVVGASFVPLAFASSRFFMTGMLALTIAVWALYALLKSDRFQNTPWVFAFAVLNGLGILTREITFFYYFIPSAVIALAGLARALPIGREGGFDFRVARHVGFNCVMTVVVTIGVFSPWYFHHVEFLTKYWQEMNADNHGPVALFEPRKTAEPEPAPEQEVEPEAEPRPAEPKKPLTRWQRYAHRGFLGRLIHTRVPWILYPVCSVNNAVFLPLFLLSLAGLAAIVLVPRFRRFDAFIIALWLLGSWFMLTVVLNFGTPRYVLPAAPAFGILGALAILGIPHVKLRRVCGGAFIALLLFQYGNLTFHNYGPVARAYVPIRLHERTHKGYNDPGLTVYKESLATSYAYSRLAAPTQANYKDRLFFAMMKAEKERESMLAGEFANYMRLSVRGMEFQERHFWPEPNPYRREDVPREMLPRRKLRSTGYGLKPEDLLSKLPNADYVVYAAPAKTEELTGTERRWLEFFGKRGFQLMERFHWPRFGRVEARNFGVLTRALEQQTMTLSGPGDIDKMGLFELYQLRRAPAYGKLNHALREYVDTRFEALLQERVAKPVKVNEHLTFMAADVAPLKEGWFMFRFIFKVHQTMDHDWRIFFHAKVHGKNAGRLPARDRAEGYTMWNFDPDPPTSAWPEGEYVIVTHNVEASKIPYWLRIGFYDRKDGYFGNSVPLGWVDFSKIAARSAQSR